VDDLAELGDRIIELLEQHPERLRAEQIRESLGVQAKELPRPLNDAISNRRIGKKGQKRATTYFARGAGGGGGAAAGGGRRAGRPAGSGRAKKGARVAGKRGRVPKVAAAPANGATATA